MKQVKRCPRFTTIRMASDGNNEAIEKILEHYNAYISKACLRPFCKMQQIPYLWVVTMGNGNIFFLKYVTNINRLSSVVYGRKDILFFSVAL